MKGTNQYTRIFNKEIYLGTVDTGYHTQNEVEHK